MTGLVTETQTPTITTAEYWYGDLLGTKLSYTTLVPRSTTRSRGYGFTLNGVFVEDKGNQAAMMDLILFRADPTGTTFTNNAVLDIADADLSKIAAIIQIRRWVPFNDNSIGMPRDAVNLPIDLGTGNQTLYAALLVRDIPTYAVGDIAVRLSGIQE